MLFATKHVSPHAHDEILHGHRLIFFFVMRLSLRQMEKYYDNDSAQGRPRASVSDLFQVHRAARLQKRRTHFTAKCGQLATRAD